MSDDDEVIRAVDLAALAEEHGGRPGFWPHRDDDEHWVGLIVRRVSVDPMVLTFTGGDGEVFRVMMRPEDLDWVIANPQLED